MYDLLIDPTKQIHAPFYCRSLCLSMSPADTSDPGVDYPVFAQSRGLPAVSIGTEYSSSCLTAWIPIFWMTSNHLYLLLLLWSLARCIRPRHISRHRSRLSIIFFNRRWRWHSTIVALIPCLRGSHRSIDVVTRGWIPLRHGSARRPRPGEFHKNNSTTSRIHYSLL
jgi:hypothetical protein